MSGAGTLGPMGGTITRQERAEAISSAHVHEEMRALAMEPCRPSCGVLLARTGDGVAPLLCAPCLAREMLARLRKVES